MENRTRRTGHFSEHVSSIANQKSQISLYSVPQNQLRESSPPCYFNIVRDVLSGRNICERFVHFSHDVQNHADVGRLVELGEDDLVGAHVTETRYGQFEALFAGGGGKHQV